MSQIVTVTHSDTSKNGKPRVFFDGKHDWKDAYYCGKTEPPPVGARVEVDTASMQTKDGKGTMWFLNKWGLVPNQPAPAEVKATVAASAVQQSANNLWAQQEATLRFVSNCVGTAIECGKVAQPSDIGGWASAALKAAQGVIAGKIEPIPFDDKF